MAVTRLPTDRDGFALPDAGTFTSTLGQKLVNPVDRVRDLATRLGLRAYEVHRVRVRWTEGARGRGVAEVVEDLHLTPTPKLTDLSGVNIAVSAIGLNEMGSVRLTEVSGRYSEYDLRGWSHDGQPPDEDEEVYYEVIVANTQGGPALMRRFTLQGVPNYNPTKVQWELSLERQQFDRDGRTGDPR